MYLITNSIKNLGRNKGRNILIAAITLAIIISTVVTLTINNAAARVVDDIRLDLGSRVEIGQSFIEMRAAGFDPRTDLNHIPIEDFIAFSESEYLRHTIFNAEMLAWSDTFFAVGDTQFGASTRTHDDGSLWVVETMKLIGTSEPDTLPDFGTYREIVEGRMFSELNEAIISEEIAWLNNINIGDVINIQGSFATDKVFDLEIVGIYSDYTEEFANPWMQMFGSFPSDNKRNEVITSFDTIVAAGWENNAGLNMQTEYFLRNPDYLASFEAQARSLGLPVTYNVSINQAAFDRVAGPLSGMNSAAITFMIVVLILGVITLALVSYMAVRERKYEVGVLRAMGMEKSKVAFGMITEAVMIAALCLVVGLGIGNAMAQPIADSLLEGRVAVEMAAIEQNQGGGQFLMTQGQQQIIGDDAAGYVPVSEIQINLGFDVILQIILITLGLAALTGIIGVVIIAQYEPLKILRERG
jgi:putative ABC transport system permease protein